MTTEGASGYGDPLDKVTPKICIFCGADSDLSREHALPVWTRAFARDTDGDDWRWRTYRAYDGEPPVTGREPTREVFREGDPFTFRPRVVCRNCNNGWLSQFDEHEAKPILGPLITGERHRLASTHSVVVARWAAMRTAITEFIDDAARVSLPESTHALKAGGLPASYQVWIGRSALTTGTLIAQQSMIGVAPGAKKVTDEDRRSRTAQFALLRIGALVLVTFSRRPAMRSMPVDLAPGVLVPLPCGRRADLSRLIPIDSEPEAFRVLDGCLAAARAVVSRSTVHGAV